MRRLQVEKEKPHLCPNEDASLAASISSLVTKDEINNIMSSTQIQQPTTFFRRQDTQQIQQQEQPTQAVEQKKEDSSKIDELEALKKQLAEVQAEKLAKEETVTKLLNKDKTNTLTKIFGEVKDESIRKT